MSEARKRRVRIGRLTNLTQISEEIGRVYRATRNKDLDSVEGYRLATILSLMAKALEASVLEGRINDIEAAMRNRDQAFRPRIVS